MSEIRKCRADAHAVDLRQAVARIRQAVARNSVHKPDAFRHFVGGQSLTGPVADFFRRRVKVRSVGEHDQRAGALSQQIVGVTGYAGIDDVGMGVENLLHLLR
jgi:hypothetical protein